MTDEQYFYETYKKAALDVQESIKSQTHLMVPTFPQDDPLRKETVRFVTEGGKRFRPTLSWLVSSYYGHTDLYPHLALESFHKYLLTHDDIIDQDSVRYGAKTVHTQLESLLSEEDGKKHFGNSMGIIGDLMDAITYKIIFTADLSAETKVALGSHVVRAVEEVVWGWYDQFLMDYLPLSSHALTYDRIITSLIWVTGKYTVKFPFYFGFQIAQVPVPHGIDELADDLGVLFQTGDDLIGLFGDPETTGKSNYGDIVQGKKTLPMWFTYTQATSEDKQILETLVGKKDLTQDEALVVREIVKRSGGLQRSQELMMEYKERCEQRVSVLDVPDDMKRFLKGFAEYLVKRDH